MKPLSKGDPCRVRLHTGDVVEAVYDYPSIAEKCHWVDIDGMPYFARSKIKETDDCRFVGPACVLLPVGVKA